MPKKNNTNANDNKENRVNTDLSSTPLSLGGNTSAPSPFFLRVPLNQFVITRNVYTATPLSDPDLENKKKINTFEIKNERKLFTIPEETAEEIEVAQKTFSSKA